MHEVKMELNTYHFFISGRAWASSGRSEATSQDSEAGRPQ